MVIFFIDSENIIDILKSIGVELFPLLAKLLSMITDSHDHRFHVSGVDEPLYYLVARRSRSSLIEILVVLDIYFEGTAGFLFYFGDDDGGETIFLVIVVFFVSY